MQAQQIVKLALATAKAPGMTTYGGQMLNLVLQDLKLHRDLKVNRVVRQFTLTAAQQNGPFPLPADYLRTYDMFYPIPAAGGATTSSITQFIVPITIEQFDAEFKSPSISNYPYEFATDLSTTAQVWSGGTPGSGTLTSAGQMFVYPQTSGDIVVTHRYMKDQPDISSPETSAIDPWFNYDQYLIKKVAAHMMGITGDDREAQYHAEAEQMLRPHMIMQGDEQETVQNVRLDPRHFHFNKGLKPTKAMPF